LRFFWPAEIEGSLVYLTANPKNAERIKANIHLDMVGGDETTKAVFRVSGGPESLPHFISDIGHEAGEFVNAQSEIHAGGGQTAFHLTAPEGGKAAQLALMEGISLGSDHQIFNEGSWRIPGIYLHDWPDRYIHTNFDRPDNIDPTKLKRAAFIALATALYLADMDAGDTANALGLLRRNAYARAGALEARLAQTPQDGKDAVRQIHWAREYAKIDSIAAFAPLREDSRKAAHEFVTRLAGVSGAGSADNDKGAKPGAVYWRNRAVKGPMDAFGYSYLEDKLGDGAHDLALPAYSGKGLNGEEIDGGVYAYEALNLVNGERSTGDIHQWLTATLAPVPLAMVEDYLAALETIGVLVESEKP
jgi:hypothetical protein